MAVGASLTTIANILKDMYLPPVVEQLNNEVLFSQRLETRDQELVGNQAVVPLHSGRSGGIFARGESQQLGDPGSQAYLKAVYDLKFLYGRVRVTGPSMAKSKNEVGAFLQVLKGEMDGIRMDIKKDFARQVYGNGDGLIATCGTTSASADVVLNDDEALRKGYLYVGRVVDIGTAADPDSLIDGEAITAVDVANKTITVTTAISTTTSNFVANHGNLGDSGSPSVKEIDAGLQKIVSATAGVAVGGLDPDDAGEEIWENERNTDGGAISLDAIHKALNRVRINGGETSAMITSFGLQRQVFNLLQSQVRYVNPMEVKGGFQTLEFFGHPIIADLDAPWGKVYLLDEKSLKIFADRDWHFLDEDGSILKWRSGYDEWEAVLARYVNLGVDRRNNQFVISGLTDTDGV